MDMSEQGKILFKRIRASAHLGIFILGLSLITGCGGVEGGEAYLEGTFMAGSVSGLNFKTDSTSGRTDSHSIFKYKDGETVTFSIGDIVLGSTVATSVVSPIDLVPGAKDAEDPTVTNIAVLLQTLDFDGYVNNGIQIPYGIDPVIKESIAENGKIAFDQSPENFMGDRAVLGLLEELNGVQEFAENTAGAIRQLASIQDARTHLQAYFNERKEVVTSYGKVKGFTLDDKTWAWFGIPFAKPPLGALRWRAPESPDKWRGAMDTVAHCLPCTQQIHNSFWQPSTNYMGSEDCLYLDIYRPKTGKTNLPVYVWIHGGINNLGKAGDFNAAVLAQQGNLLVVVIQYRLGAMGWLTHPALRDAEDAMDASGNYGMLDHIKALRWVKENIAAFGGNPNNVTVGGQSSGAHNALNLVVSPAAKGLFNKVVLHSPALESRNVEEGDRMTSAMIDWLLVDDETADTEEAAALVRARMSFDELKSYLRSKEAAKIIDACRVGIGNGIIPSNAAFHDGALLSGTSWLEAISSGKYNKVPMLIGSNEFEFKNLMPLQGEFLNSRFPSVPSGKYTWGDLYKVLDGNLSLDSVFPTRKDKEFYNAVGHLRSRLWKAANVDAIAGAIKADDASTPVYAYRFDWSGGGDSTLMDFDFIFGASHGMELPFFFGGSRNVFGYSFTKTNEPGRIALQKAMVTYLSNFIDRADPNSADSSLFEWPQWSNAEGDPKVIILDAGLSDIQLSVSSQKEKLTSVFADISAARKNFNNTSELGYMDFFKLTLPEG